MKTKHILLGIGGALFVVLLGFLLMHLEEETSEVERAKKMVAGFSPATAKSGPIDTGVNYEQEATAMREVYLETEIQEWWKRRHKSGHETKLWKTTDGKTRCILSREAAEKLWEINAWAIPFLIRQLASENRNQRMDAVLLLSELAPETHGFGFDPDMAGPKRKVAIIHYEEWWREKAATFQMPDPRMLSVDN